MNDIKHRSLLTTFTPAVEYHTVCTYFRKTVISFNMDDQLKKLFDYNSLSKYFLKNAFNKFVWLKGTGLLSALSMLNIE